MSGDALSGQRAKYERVVATFARGEAVRLDAPGGGEAVYLATYSGLIHVWFADDAPRPDTGEGPRTTHFAYRGGDAGRFGPWIRALLLLVEPDAIAGVPLLESPFVDPDADTETGVGFRDPDPKNVYRTADDPDGDLEGLSLDGL
jgi:hypothetical protein